MEDKKAHARCYREKHQESGSNNSSICSKKLPIALGYNTSSKRPTEKRQKLNEFERMVRQGWFEIELINAETKVPFKEHTHTDGRTYSEVEPDADYFIRVKGHNLEVAVVKLSIDGKDLGYQSPIHKTYGWVEKGLFKRQNGSDSHNALRFNKLYNPRNVVGDDEYEGHWTGSVELKVSKYVQLNEYASLHDSKSSWTPNADAVLDGLNMSSNKKACNTVHGKTQTAVSKTKAHMLYTGGDHLETIKLYYCSTVGLFAAKVLKPPPRQSFAAARPRPAKKSDSDDDEHDDVKEERSSQRRRLDNGSGVKVTTVVRTQTVEQLDLTNDDCSI